MDFSKLDHSDLHEFLLGFGVQPDPVVEEQFRQAQELFHDLEIEGAEFPLPIIDLYLAGHYQGLKDKYYTFDQIYHLTQDQINEFAEAFGFTSSTSNVDRDRIYRILSYLGLIIPERSHLTQNVQQSICDRLTLSELVSYIMTGKETELNCQIEIKDRDGHVTNVNKLTKDNFKMLMLIEKLGSIKTLDLLVKDRNYQMIKMLHQYGVPLEKTIIWAVEAGDVDLVQNLLEIGADPNSYESVIFMGRRKEKMTILMTAVLKDDLEMVKILLQYGADPNIIDAFNRNALTLILDKYNFGRDNYEEIAKVLVDYGADINLLVENSHPVIVDAIEIKDLEHLKLIIDLGADVNLPTSKGLTALNYAIITEFTRGVRILLENGADPNISHRNGLTSLELARQTGNDEIIRLLK